MNPQIVDNKLDLYARLCVIAIEEEGFEVADGIHEGDATRVMQLALKSGEIVGSVTIVFKPGGDSIAWAEQLDHLKLALDSIVELRPLYAWLQKHKRRLESAREAEKDH